MSGDLSQRTPFWIVEARDGEPAIFPGARISAVRRRRLVGGAVAVARPDAPVGRPVENGRAADHETDLRLRGVDPLALARARAVEERAQHRQREAVGAHPVEIRIAPAGWNRWLGGCREFVRTGERIRVGW